MNRAPVFTAGPLRDPMRALKALFGCLAVTCMVLAMYSVDTVKAAVRPNVVVIQTDDQPLAEFHGTWRDLYNNDRQIMPNTMRLIRNKGIEFSNYITPFPLCAPSRASLLSGQYAQNHGVIRIGGPRGGYQGYESNRINNENLAVWLQRAGYRTMHYGKFMNYYGGPDAPAEKTVPPGWDRWVTDATDNSTREFYGYQQNIDGRLTGRLGNPFYDSLGGKDPIGCPDFGLAVCNYHTDSMSLQAEEEIRSSGRRPFYLQVDYHTPHGDSRPPAGPEPAVRHYDTAIKTPTPRPPGFNEADVSDKPWFLRDGPPFTRRDVTQITAEYRKSIEALQSVDEGVKGIIKALRETGKLKDTYVIFTSDNGFFLGQHRISRGKLLAYEPALRVPMVIRGPGIEARTTSRELTANQDIAPTILHLTGAVARSRIDGRSMARFWRSPKRLSRRPILLSSYQSATHFIPGDYPDDPPVITPTKKGAHVSAKPGSFNYVGIRVGPYKYVNYEEGGGESELYVLTQDPAELKNRFGRPRYAEVQAYLDEELARLRACKGATCRVPAAKWPTPPYQPPQ